MAGAAMGGIFGLIGSYLEGQAATDAAGIQANSAQLASQTQQATTEEGIAAQAQATGPGRNIGAVALYRLADLLGIDPRTAFPGSTGTGGAGASAQANALAHQGLDDYAAYAVDGMTGGSSEQPVLANPTDISRLRGQSLIPELPMPEAPSDRFGSLTHRFSLADFEKDPGYEFRRTEGARGIENSAAAHGMQLSGANLRALDRYNQDYASGEFGVARNRYVQDQSDEYNRLASLAGIGQTAAQQTGDTAANGMFSLAGQQGENIIGAGNASAAGVMGAGNAYSSGFSNFGNNLQQQYYLSQLFNGGGNYSGPETYGQVDWNASPGQSGKL